MNSIIENEFVLGVIHSKFRTSECYNWILQSEGGKGVQNSNTNRRGAHFLNKRNCLVATGIRKALTSKGADAISLLLIVALMFIVVRFSNLLGKSGSLHKILLNMYS